MAEAIEREKSFYGAALSVAKEGSASTGYGMPINQQMRFDELQKQVLAYQGDVDGPYSLLDVGSGTGDLPEYLIRHGNQLPAEYLGLDILPEMTKVSRERHKANNWSDDWDFKTGVVNDKFALLNGEDSWDYVVSVAAYALKEHHESQMENVRVVQQAIDNMAYMAKRAVFVTLFSTWKTNIIPEEMVLDPMMMFAWAKSKWERVDLIHSYAPFDFTLVIYPEPSPWRREWSINELSRLGQEMDRAS